MEAAHVAAAVRALPATAVIKRPQAGGHRLPVSCYQSPGQQLLTTATASAAAAAPVPSGWRHCRRLSGCSGRQPRAEFERAAPPSPSTRGCSSPDDGLQWDVSYGSSGGHGGDGGGEGRGRRPRSGGDGSGSGEGGANDGGHGRRGADDADLGRRPSYTSVGLSRAVASWLLGGVVAALWGCLAPPPVAASAAAAAAAAGNHTVPAPPVIELSLLPPPPGGVLEVHNSSGAVGPSGHASVSTVTAAIDGVEGSMSQRLKRLLREAFAEVTELRLRLEALEAAGAEAAAAGEAAVVPLEGFSVRPVSRALAPGMRLRCAAQVSGTVDAPALVPLAVAEQGPEGSEESEAARRAGAGEDSGSYGVLRTEPSWSDLVDEAGLSAVPRLCLSIQSVWGRSAGDAAAAPAMAAAVRQPLSRRAVAAGESVSAQEEERPVAAHLQLATAPGGRHLEVDKLLLKAEAHPRLRLLLATHGSLENIGRNVNPFAAGTGARRGLTEAMRRGHDLALLSDGGGFGAAVAASAGDLSLAVGAFTSNDSNGSGETATASAAAFSTPATSLTTTCAQLSLHRARRVALSALWTSSESAGADDVAASLSPGSDGITGGGGACGHSGSDFGGGGDGRRVQRGLVAAAQLTERLTAAVWAGDALCGQHRPAGGSFSIGGGGTSPSAGEAGDGGPLAPWADSRGATPPHKQQQQPSPWCWERRLGLRLATLPNTDTGRSYGLSISHRQRLGDSAAGPAGSVLMAEASAALPLAHGVVLTPGLVLLRHSGSGGAEGRRGGAGSSRTLLLAVAQTSWCF